MAANTFISLPVVSDDGVGASVDISGLAPGKTIAVTGSFGGSVQVEISDDDVLFVPLTASCAAPCVLTVTASAGYARVRSFGVVGTPAVDVAAPDEVASSVEVAIPAGDNGTGADVDVSNLEPPVTALVAGGPFAGSVTLEGSLDGVNFGDLTSFGAPGHRVIRAPMSAMRVRIANLDRKGAVSAWVRGRGAALPPINPDQQLLACTANRLAYFGGADALSFVPVTSGRSYATGSASTSGRAALLTPVMMHAVANTEGLLAALITGGITTGGLLTDAMQRFDTAGNTMSSVGVLPAAIYQHGMCVVPDGVLAAGNIALTYGGFTAYPPDPAVNLNAAIYSIDPNAAYATALLTTLPAGASTDLVGNIWADYVPTGPTGNPGLIVMVTVDDGILDPHTDVWFYDLVGAVWSQLQTLPVGLYNLGTQTIDALGQVSATLMSNGQIMVGSSNGLTVTGVADAPLNATPTFDPTTGLWVTTTAASPAYLGGFSYITPGTAHVFLDCQGRTVSKIGEHSWRYTPGTDSWEVVDNTALVLFQTIDNWAAVWSDGTVAYIGSGSPTNADQKIFEQLSTLVGVQRTQVNLATSYSGAYSGTFNMIGHRCGGNIAYYAV